MRKKATMAIALCLFVAALALVYAIPKAGAFGTFYDANCTACHSSTVNTCNGCHSHGVHSSSAKSDINVTGMTDKSTYLPGENVIVTITGGYRTGWIRAILYDQTMTELARSSCPGGMGGCTTSVYPVTLTVPAPAMPGTYTWNVSWYGNQFDATGAFFQPTCSDIVTTNCWKPSSNPNHGEEIVSINSFTVSELQNIVLDPPLLDFGSVVIGDSPTLPTEIRNTGGADLEVSNIALCAGTSTEFTWAPITLPFTVAPGGSQTLSVSYMPTDNGTDNGCIEITSNDPDTPIAPLQVAGQVLPETACFDGIDNDGDGLIDCADSDCAGAVNGVCDTGLPGVCAAGTTTCQGGAAVCVQDTQPTDETIAAGNCNDGLDNDCDGLTDIADAGCVPPLVETECFDGIDNDTDGAIDCADSDCDGVVGPATDCGVGACASTGNRVCQGGVEVDTCTPGAPGTEVCTGGIDEDCDGFVDCADTADCAADPACQGETLCFDGMDNDGNGLTDCADPNCDGVVGPATDCGVGACASTGNRVCQGGVEVDTCTPGAPGTEVCTGGIDEDCDGFVDCADTDCAADPVCVVAGDVGLFKLIVPEKIPIPKKKDTGQRVITVLAQATGITEEVMATVALTAEDGAGVMVTIEPASITQPIEPSVEGEIEATRFGFKATIVCVQEGAWAVNWTATISAAQNSNPANDVLMGTSQVICK